MLEKSFKYHEILLQNNHIKCLKIIKKRAFLATMQVTNNQTVGKQHLKRALVRVLKGVFCKPKGRLLQAKRACIQNHDVKDYDKVIGY